MKCIMLIILTIIAELSFGQSDNMSQETKFYSNRFKCNETYNNKVRLGKSTTYANTVMTLRPI